MYIAYGQYILLCKTARSRLQEALRPLILTEARVFNKNQRRILLPDDASYMSPSNSTKTQSFAKAP